MAPTSTFAEIRKLGTSWHALCCVFGYYLAVACLASYPGFLAIAFTPCGTMNLVGAMDENAEVKSLNRGLITFACLVMEVQYQTASKHCFDGS